MTPEDCLLLACTRQDFLSKHRDTVRQISAGASFRWSEVFAAAERHGVAPLVRLNLRQCGDPLSLPRDIAEKFETSYCLNVIRKQETTRTLAAALAWFNERAVDVMLLKGAALDLLVYDQPWYTAADDIDLVLRCKRGTSAFEITDERAFQLAEEGIEANFFEHHDVTMNGVLPVDFERIWENARPIQLQDARAFVMSPEDLFLSVCINSCRKRFFRLKALCDIAESTRRLPDLDWNALVCRAREFECGNIVYAALFVTRETLGCEIPSGVLENLEVPPSRARLIRGLACHLIRRHSFALRSSFLLPYASYRWSQAWRSLARSLDPNPANPARAATRIQRRDKANVRPDVLRK